MIELLISVAIVAILAAVAMAAYSIFVTQSRRSDATTAIKTIQFAEENYRANNTTYGTLAQVGGSSTSSNGFSDFGYRFRHRKFHQISKALR